MSSFLLLRSRTSGLLLLLLPPTQSRTPWAREHTTGTESVGAGARSSEPIPSAVEWWMVGIDDLTFPDSYLTSAADFFLYPRSFPTFFANSFDFHWLAARTI